MRFRFELFVALSMVCLAVGCDGRPPTYLVHGMVVFPDGKPLTSGTIEFEALKQEEADYGIERDRD